MGLVVDTGVFVHVERRKLAVDWANAFGTTALHIAAISVSELLVGAYRADNRSRREFRFAALEAIQTSMPVLDFTGATAKVHAPILADMQGRGQMIGAHDLIIAATALEHGHSVLTTNRRDFERVTGLAVVEFPV